MTSKKNQLAIVTTIPASSITEAGRFVPRNGLQQLPFWNTLKERDQETLTEEIRAYSAAALHHFGGALAMGKHLQNIKSTCKPYSGSFRRIVSHLGYKNERAAYRYIEAYNNVCDAFRNNDNLVKAAIVGGLDFVSSSSTRPLGKYTDVVKALPPPAVSDPAESSRYVEQLKDTYKQRNRAIASGIIEKDTEEEVQKSPELLQLTNFRGVKNALKHIPKRQRERWFKKHVGMCMTIAGYSSAVTFEPEAVPEEFRQGPGRPHLVHEIA